ncbi:hypothetical protein RPHASCH2410_CH14775 [Rhizobium phaseoli Ch24-10]|nr:hypothetical protein RPHASCH2410_CH14775 [Rhizobium phaseoli Ch24-10]
MGSFSMFSRIFQKRSREKSAILLSGKTTSIGLSLAFLLTVSLANGSRIPRYSNSAALKKRLHKELHRHIGK